MYPGRLSKAPGAETSNEAALDARAESDSIMRAYCLAAVRLCGPLTHEAMHTIITVATGDDDISRSTPGCRANELYALGVLRATGNRAQLMSGKAGLTWVDARLLLAENLAIVRGENPVEVFKKRKKHEDQRLRSQMLIPIKHVYKKLELEELRDATLAALVELANEANEDEEDSYEELRWNLIELRREFTARGWWPDDPSEDNKLRLAL